LNTGTAMNAYLLTDRASWLKFGNKGDLALLYAGDPALLNQYSYIPVNAKLHPHVSDASVVKLGNWLIGDGAKELINGYKIDGTSLFTHSIPNLE
ncbi:MAG: sulfate ABC transporter substrate-binding protein, partial [Marinosulfonomonas sp.]|nr:sulfate ABC transporter substrate-binding protein [Marinosulfonomonas sp.]